MRPHTHPTSLGSPHMPAPEQSAGRGGSGPQRGGDCIGMGHRVCVSSQVGNGRGVCVTPTRVPGVGLLLAVPGFDKSLVLL